MKIEEEHKEQGNILQLVSFSIGDEEYGIDILMVREIIKMIGITKVPTAPDFIEGVINLRGRIIPIIYLRKKMNMEKKEFDKKTRIIVVEMDGTTAGFIVDEVNEVLRISDSITEDPPEFVGGETKTEFIKAVAKMEDRLLILLDMNKILNFKETEALNDVAAA